MFDKKMVLSRVWNSCTTSRNKIDQVGSVYLTDDESKNVGFLTKESENMIDEYFAQDGYYSCEKEGNAIVVYDSYGNAVDSSEYPHSLRVGDYTLMIDIEEEEEYND